MIQVNLDLVNEEFRQILREEIKNAVADVVRQNQLPPMLTRKELMELFKFSGFPGSRRTNSNTPIVQMD